MFPAQALRQMQLLFLCYHVHSMAAEAHMLSFIIHLPLNYLLFFLLLLFILLLPRIHIQNSKTWVLRPPHHHLLLLIFADFLVDFGDLKILAKKTRSFPTLYIVEEKTDFFQ